MMKLFKAKSLKNTNKSGKLALNEKKQEKASGRSMVEMLGVLAIIGVLSIGGIQGYTMAMRKYRANEIMALVNKYALTVYTSCQKQMIDNPEYAHIYYRNDSNNNYSETYNDDNDRDSGEWFCQRLYFTDSGLGPLPNGVLNIGGYHNDVHELAGVRIVSQASGDIVVMPIYFKDKDLCETVMAMTSEQVADDGHEHYLCGKDYNFGVGYVLHAGFIVNH